MGDLEAFLIARLTNDTAAATHVRFGAKTGKFRVPEDELAELFRLYALEGLAAAPPLGLCELPLADGVPLIVDLDIAAPLAGSPPAERLWDLGAATVFCKVLGKFFAERFNIEDASLSFYILARERGYAKDGMWKDGLHIQCPELFMPAACHRTLRHVALKALAADDLSLPKLLGAPDSVTLSNEAVWDNAPTSGKQPWFLLGATKEGTTPYNVVRLVCFNANGDADDNMSYDPSDLPDAFSPRDLLRTLSMRFPAGYDVFQPTDAFAEEILSAEMAATTITTAAAGGGPAEPVGELRPKVASLLGLLSVARAERTGLTHGGEQGCGEVIQTVWNILGEDGRDLALGFAQRSERHWASPAAAKSAAAWFKSTFHAFGNRGVGALVKWAQADAPDGYAEWLLSQPRSPFSGGVALTADYSAKLLREITGLSTEGVELIPDKSGTLPFCAPFLYGDPSNAAAAAAAGLSDLTVFAQDGASVVIRSHLGTGKTTLFRALAADPTKSVLYVSARRTFTFTMVAEFNAAGLGFRSYMSCLSDCDGMDCQKPTHVPQAYSTDDPRCQRFFCQVESLHKFFGKPRYDMVVLDESESVLASLQPGTTQRKHLVRNMEVFQQLVSSAGVVVAGDAFVTDRTMAALKALRPGPLKLLLNTHNPYTSRVCERLKVMTANKDGLATESVAKGKEQFHARMAAELDKGKRLVVVCGSAQEAKDLEEGVFKKREAAELAEGRVFRYRLYWAKEEYRDARNADLEDVNAAWSQLNVLCYTPTITVGINYTAKPFDIMFLYATRMGATARDLFQASLRCRSLADDRLVFFLSHKGAQAHPTGRANIMRRFTEVTGGSSMLKIAAVKEAAEEAAAKLKKGGPAGGIMVAAAGAIAENAELPAWFMRLLVANTNEAAVCQTLPEETYAHFLAECGYCCHAGCDLAHEHKHILLPTLSGEGLALEKFEMVMPYKDLAELVAHSAEFNRIEMLSKTTIGNYFMAERQAMTKFYFMKRCGLLSGQLRKADTSAAAAADEELAALQKSKLGRVYWNLSDAVSAAQRDHRYIKTDNDDVWAQKQQVLNDAKAAFQAFCEGEGATFVAREELARAKTWTTVVAPDNIWASELGLKYKELSSEVFKAQLVIRPRVSEQWSVARDAEAAFKAFCEGEGAPLQARMNELITVKRNALVVPAAAPPAWATPENLELLWGTEEATGFARGDSAKFWHASVEKMTPADGAFYASRHDAAIGFAVLADLQRANLTTQLFLVRQTLKVLGMEYSAQAKTWTDAEWAALPAAFSAVTEWPDLPAASEFKRVSLWERLRVGFGLRHRYAEADDGAAAEHRSPAIHLRDDLNRVLSAWTGTELKSRKAGAAEQVREGLGERDLKADYATFSAALRKELTSDASFSPTKLKAGATPKSRQPAADWEAGASPTARAAAIQKRIDELWAAEKAKLGVGEAKFHQPLQFFTAPLAGGLMWTAVVKEELRNTDAPMIE